MTVEQIFEVEKLTMTDVVNIADESDYWQRASNFIVSNWRLHTFSMTAKQQAWINSILEDMTERRIEGDL